MVVPACPLEQHGQGFANAWLLTFLYSSLQDALLYSPLLILFHHVFLPLHIKVGDDCSSSRTYIYWLHPED